MKNKIIVFCIILTMLLSLATFTALLVPRISNDTDTEDTGSESVLPEDESITKKTISFYWDDVEYTVEEGTTFRQFVSNNVLEIDFNTYRICPNTGYIDCYQPKNGSCYLTIDPDGIIQAGEYYGVEARAEFTYGDNLYDFHNGATWKSYLSVIELSDAYCENPLEKFTIGDDGCIYYNGSYSHLCSNNDDHEHETDDDPHGDDLIIAGLHYTTCK